MTAYGGLYIAGGLLMKDVGRCQILLLGASGGVGTMAVQLLKAQKAKVVSTCSADAVPLVKALGADNVFDYHQANYESEVAARGRYDVILDCCKFGFENLPKSWKYTNFVNLNSPLLVNTDEQGLILGLTTSAGNLLSSNIFSILEGRSIRWGFFVPSTSGFQFIDKLVKRQRIKPVIHKVFKFHELPKGLEMLSAGHLRGKIVVDFGENL
ncbi:reticulon-4-interacting protein 1 homolog, mitochondrial-like isoform X2 [Agrilus planipennis]|nr:reticulon-4-interacting protein 1 homolog, mitochondrial-like isoform X2 [Agrilus planipennis]